MITWVTVAQASDILGMSERSIRRYIAEGKLDSRMEGSRRLVKVEIDDDKTGMLGVTLSDKDAMIAWLKNELEEKNKQIERLQEEIREIHERSDAIVMRLADELEAQRNILEGRKSEQKSGSLWRRLRRGEDGND